VFPLGQVGAEILLGRQQREICPALPANAHALGLEVEIQREAEEGAHVDERDLVDAL